MIDDPADIRLPAKPAIIRPAEHSLLKPGAFRPVTRAERRAIIADLLRTKRLTRREAEQALLFVPVVGWSVEEPYVANAVDFNGSVYLSLGSNLAPNSDYATFSCWLWLDTSSGGGVAGGSRSSLTTRWPIVNGNWFAPYLSAVGGGDVIQYDSATTIFGTGAWHHVMFSFDLDNASNRHVYIDDTLADGSYNIYNTSGTIDWTWGNWYIGDCDQFAGNWNGRMADFLLWTTGYIDLSVEANRRMFIDTSGKPVDPNRSGGAIAALGTPDIMLTRTAASWHENNGGAGNFTVHGGSLSVAASSPSD